MPSVMGSTYYFVCFQDLFTIAILDAQNEDLFTYFLSCSYDALIRCDLLDSVNAILQTNGLSNLSLQEMTKVLLYGHERLPADANKKILLATLEYIHASERFQ